MKAPFLFCLHLICPRHSTLSNITFSFTDNIGLSGSLVDWFTSYLSGHIQSVPVHLSTSVPEDVLMIPCKMEVGGHRKIGRPQLRWSDVIRNT